MKNKQLKYSKTIQADQRRSSQRSQTNEFSPNKKTENQDLGSSQIVSDFGKSQQSFRSQGSPQISPSTKLSQSQVIGGGRSSLKRSSTIINKSSLNQFHERSVIRLLGLNMEAVCPKSGHDKNKILFICQNQKCTEERLGCAYCQLQNHQDHPSYNMDVQTFCKQFDDKYREFNDQLKCMLSPSDRSQQIKDSFGQLRQQVSDRLYQIEQSVLDTIQKHLQYEPKQNDIVNRVESLSKKNIFEMTGPEMWESIEFVQGKHCQIITEYTESQNLIILKATQEADKAWQDYINSLEQDIQNALSDNKQIFILDQNSKEYASLKLKVYEEKEARLSKEKVVYNQIIEHHKEQERIQEQIRQEQQLQQQQLEQMRKIQEELKQQEEENNKKQYIEIEERERILRTFPHILYTEDCIHRQKCNTIPIFSCCNKAYPCTQCHGYKCHPPKISVPSYRYCMRCLEIYLVIYPTNQAVNCLKCK